MPTRHTAGTPAGRQRLRRSCRAQHRNRQWHPSGTQRRIDNPRRTYRTSHCGNPSAASAHSSLHRELAPRRSLLSGTPRGSDRSECNATTIALRLGHQADAAARPVKRTPGPKSPWPQAHPRLHILLLPACASASAQSFHRSRPCTAITAKILAIMQSPNLSFSSQPDLSAAFDANDTVDHKR